MLCQYGIEVSLNIPQWICIAMEKEMKPGVGVSVEGEEKLDPWSH